MKAKINEERFNEFIKTRTLSHKLKLIKSERTPEVIKRKLQETLFTEKQREVIELLNKSDLTLLIHDGGTGSGKTYVNNYLFLSALKMIRREADETYPKGYKPKVLLAGYTLANIKTNVIDEIENEFGIKIKMDQHNNFELFGVKVITEYTNSVKSEKSSRGSNAWFCYVNEAATAHPKAFSELIRRLRVGRKPFMIADTNPEHPHHWLKVDYIDKAYGVNDERDLESEKEELKAKGYYRVHSSPLDNPHLADNYVQSLMNLPAGPIRDRAMGEWATGEGAVYSNFDAKVHYVSSDEVPSRSEFSSFYAGVDWGWKAPTSFILIGETSKGVKYLLEEESKPGTPIEYWKELGKKWKKEYGNRMPFYADHEDPEKNKELRKAGINVINANKQVMNGIEAVTKEFENKTLFIVEDSVDKFKDEIAAYQWDSKKGNVIKKDDHTLDALRYAIYTHIKKGQPFRRY